MSRRRNWIWLCLAAAALFGLTACQSAPAPRPAAPPAVTVATPTRGAARRGKVSAEQLVPTDPCAIRLQDIGGALLSYYAVNKRLPEKLEELRPYADSDLILTCPVSNQSYIYVPAGLVIQGRTKRIIVHDPAPSHAGQRWCVFMAETRPGEAQSIEALEIPEGVFRLYQSAAE